MAKVYYRKIKAGAMSLDDVPERWREAVQKLMEAEAEQNGGGNDDGIGTAN